MTMLTRGGMPNRCDRGGIAHVAILAMSIKEHSHSCHRVLCQTEAHVYRSYTHACMHACMHACKHTLRSTQSTFFSKPISWRFGGTLIVMLELETYLL